MSQTPPFQPALSPAAQSGDGGLDQMGALFDIAAPQVSVAEAEALACSLFGLKTVAKPLTGERDSNFQLVAADGPGYVLKVIHPAEDENVTDFQSKVLLHITAADPTLATPQLIKTTDGLIHGTWRRGGEALRRVRCLTYLPGRPLHLAPKTAAQRRNLGDFLGRLDRALQGFSHPAQNHDLIWDMKRSPRLLPMLDELPDPDRRALPVWALEQFRDRVLPHLDELRCQVIHNDFNPHNVLADSANGDVISGIIDFGDMVYGPMIQDLATAAAYQVTPDGHPLQGPLDMIAAFHAVLPLSPLEIELLPVMLATRLAMTISISSWRARRHPDNAAYIQRNQAAAWSGLERLRHLAPGEAASWLAQQLSR